jgi:DnaJ-domain-containing protein 1
MDTQRKTKGRLDPDAEIGLGAPPLSDGPCCSWPGCSAAGEYPAPQSTRELRQFVWFCLDHVREYNRNWNFFAGMDEREIEAHRRADTTWHRPSWRFGTASLDETSRFRDPFGFFADQGPRNTYNEAGGVRSALGKAAQMMAVLNLEIGFTLEELKRRYKTLVKRHHPDLHGGDRDAEERLKQINEAYSYLMANQLHR